MSLDALTVFICSLTFHGITVCDVNGISTAGELYMVRVRCFALLLKGQGLER